MNLSHWCRNNQQPPESGWRLPFTQSFKVSWNRLRWKLGKGKTQKTSKGWAMQWAAKQMPDGESMSVGTVSDYENPCHEVTCALGGITLDMCEHLILCPGLQSPSDIQRITILKPWLQNHQVVRGLEIPFRTKQMEWIRPLVLIFWCVQKFCTNHDNVWINLGCLNTS